jgi:hypothetical protein
MQKPENVVTCVTVSLLEGGGPRLATRSVILPPALGRLDAGKVPLAPPSRVLTWAPQRPDREPEAVALTGEIVELVGSRG